MAGSAWLFAALLTKESAICLPLVAALADWVRLAGYGELGRAMPAALSQALASTGIERLYAHQVDAIEAVRRGENVVSRYASGPRFTIMCSPRTTQWKLSRSRCPCGTRVVPPRIDGVLLDGFLERAIGLMGMCAVGIAAFAQVLAEFGETGGQVLGPDA